jgi:prepilin-type N-terminal cleavage/methylation domain-containing protein
MRATFLPYIDGIFRNNRNQRELNPCNCSNKGFCSYLSNGFSLLEVLVVIAILALAGVVAIPNLIDWRSHMRLRAAATELKENLELAKTMAAKENMYIYVEFVPLEGKYRLSYKDLDGNMIPIKEERLPQDVIIDKTHAQYTVTNDKTGFNSRGGANNCTIVLTNLRKKSKIISISPIGKVEVKS